MLTEFLARESPEKYDFKFLLPEYWECYQPEIYRNMLRCWEQTWPDCSLTDADAIRRWYAYKAFELNYINQTGQRVGRLFDCDSSNETNDLMDCIYDILWRNAPWPVPELRQHMGGDTMHSFAYTFNAVAERASYPLSFEAYRTNPSSFQALRAYAAMSGCLGNFVLVPNGFNPVRGRTLWDDWDLSLETLRRHDENCWLQAVGLTFTQYINLSFLWEDVDEEGCVRPLVPSHAKVLQGTAEFPRTFARQRREEAGLFASNACGRIRRRGKFMVAMLQIAQNKKEDYAKILTLLWRNTYLGSLEKVVKLLQCLPLSAYAHTILNQLEQEL